MRGKGGVGWGEENPLQTKHRTPDWKFLFQDLARGIMVLENNTFNSHSASFYQKGKTIGTGKLRKEIYDKGGVRHDKIE